MQPYSTQEFDDIKHVASLGAPWEQRELDLSEDRQWHFLLRQVERAGITDETHPEYMKALRAGRDADRGNGGPAGRAAARAAAPQAAAGMQDANTVTAFGVNNAHTQSLGAAYSAIVNGTVFTSLYVQLIDTKTEKVLGEKSSGPVYGEGEYLPIDLTGLAPSAEDLLMVFTWTYQPTLGAPITAGSMRVSTTELPVGAPNVEQPLLTKTGKNYIKIGLGRPSGAPDCDYWYNEPNIQQPNIRLPLKVTQKFKSAIKQPLWPSNITNPPVISLAKPSTGGVTTPISFAAIQAGITASGDTLTFNFPFNNDVTKDGSIQFGPAAWANDTTLLATIALGVKTETSNNEFVWVNLYTPAAPPYATSPSPGIYWMYPLYYTWHCVAAGTQVALAGGGTKAIEDIAGGEEVRTPGRTLTVVDTFGTDKEDEVLAVHTDDGRELVITHMHPVLTREGLVAARDLVEGDHVVTEGGLAGVTRVEKRHYKGLVYCIGLGVDPEATDDAFFFANGIAVGDNLACVRYLQKYQKRLKTVLARIPEAFHPEAERSYAARYGANG